ncbi:MAG: DUF4870 domain-containing protein [Fimbriimonadaceae bacterium]|nr:MAG: DUF4870 domain-containing protein [Fimbriimonadaceae bacterium]
MEPTSEEKQLAMIAHIGPLVLGLITAAVGGWIVPLVIYLMKKDGSKFVGYHALQSLIFQIILGVSAAVLLTISPFTCFLSLIPLAIGAIAALIFQINAAIKANEGQWYALPIAGDFAKKSIGP